MSDTIREATKSEPKPFEQRARTSRGRQDRVCQAMGVREACLALCIYPMSIEMMDALSMLGVKADEVALANDGMVMTKFHDALARRLKEAANA